MNNMLIKCEKVGDIPEFMKQIMAKESVIGRLVTDDDLLEFVNGDLRMVLSSCREIIMQKKLTRNGYLCWCIYNGAVKQCMLEGIETMSLTAILNNRKHNFASGTFEHKKRLFDVMLKCGMFTKTGESYKPNPLDVPWLDFDRKFFGGR